MTKYDVSQFLHGGQDQDGGPQLPLLGHGDEVESPNWACRCLSQALGCQRDPKLDTINGLLDRKRKIMRSANIYKVARAKSLNHRCLFLAMEMSLRAQIGQVGTVVHEMAILKHLGT